MLKVCIYLDLLPTKSVAWFALISSCIHLKITKILYNVGAAKPPEEPRLPQEPQLPNLGGFMESLCIVVIEVTTYFFHLSLALFLIMHYHFIFNEMLLIGMGLF